MLCLSRLKAQVITFHGADEASGNTSLLHEVISHQFDQPRQSLYYQSMWKKKHACNNAG